MQAQRKCLGRLTLGTKMSNKIFRETINTVGFYKYTLYKLTKCDLRRSRSREVLLKGRQNFYMRVTCPGALWIMHNGLNHVNVVLVHVYHLWLLLFDLSIMQSSLPCGRHIHSHSAYARGRGKRHRVNYSSMLSVERHWDPVTFRLCSNKCLVTDR